MPDVVPDDLPRSPTGRIPRWVIDDAARAATSWVPGEPPPPPPTGDPFPLPGLPPAYPNAIGRRPDDRWREPAPRVASFSLGRTLRLLVAGLVVVGLVAGVSGRLRDLGFSTRPSGVAMADGGPGSVSVPADWPSPARDVSSTPLASPPVVVDPNGSYAFVRTQPDGVRPVAYDPCRPIHFVVRTAGQPEGADRLLVEAVAQVSRATGLVFVADGETTETPSLNRAPTDFDRYGDRWAPVLIAWQTAAEEPALAGAVVGQGGSTSVSRTTLGGASGPEVFVTGQVVLDSEDLGRLIGQGPEGEAAVRAVLMHELAHVVGLDHIADSAQLMNPTQTRGVLGFADGDLTGLAALGAGDCFPGM